MVVVFPKDGDVTIGCSAVPRHETRLSRLRLPPALRRSSNGAARPMPELRASCAVASGDARYLEFSRFELGGMCSGADMGCGCSDANKEQGILGRRSSALVRAASRRRSRHRLALGACAHWLLLHACPKQNHRRRRTQARSTAHSIDIRSALRDNTKINPASRACAEEGMVIGRRYPRNLGTSAVSMREPPGVTCRPSNEMQRVTTQQSRVRSTKRLLRSLI